MDVYSASERFPKFLLGPKGASYDVAETALQEALGTPKSRWDWLSERVRPDQITNDGVGYSGVADPQNWTHLQPDSDGLIKRPELDNFGLAMVGGGKVSGAALPFGNPLFLSQFLVESNAFRLSLGRTPQGGNGGGCWGWRWYGWFRSRLQE
jgi:hypothetical protein